MKISIDVLWVCMGVNALGVIWFALMNDWGWVAFNVLAAAMGVVNILEYKEDK